MSKRAVAVVALLIGLGLGGVVGFLSGAASSKFGQEVVKGMFATEKAADTANAQQLNRKYFSVQMPANWKVDTGMEDYDPDTYFNVESPGGNTVFFMVYDVATDPKENVQHQLAFYDDYVKKARKKPFSRWGQYNGHGMEYKGRLMGRSAGQFASSRIVRPANRLSSLKNFMMRIRPQRNRDFNRLHPHSS
jgi:hypothetical protein